MQSPQHKPLAKRRRLRRHASRTRLYLVLIGMLCLGTAIALVLNAFSSNLVFFHSPTEIYAHPPSPATHFRLGGIVVAGSFHQEGPSKTSRETTFDVTDGHSAVHVSYRGILPDLFREGQSVVVEGSLISSNNFRASEVLAKHDENYVPRSVAQALKKSGKWDPRFGSPPTLPQ